ncbi:hypothetical protein Tco_0306291 [Tanacetum coccineum]
MLQSNHSPPLALQLISPLKGARVVCFVNRERYRGNGEVGKGEGELGMLEVLGRWFWLETVGKRWYGVGGKAVMVGRTVMVSLFKRKE